MTNELAGETTDVWVARLPMRVDVPTAMTDLETAFAHAEVLAGELLDALAERDRARATAVLLEQENAELTARIEDVVDFAQSIRCGPECTMGDDCDRRVISDQLLAVAVRAA